MKSFIRTERLTEEFCQLVSVDSVSYHERKMADILKEKLEQLGVSVFEDTAGNYYGSDTGNLYGFLKGELEGTPLLFSAHMDTVEPGIGKKAVRRPDGIITSDGNTVLGADDVAGIAAILEAIRILKENKIPHRDIELLFPVAEEAYVMGSRMVDYRRFRAKEAYVLDLSGAVGTASLREPTLISFVIEVKGKSAHAGFAPETGVHAITLASEAIMKIQQGRIDDDTTVNIGKIMGGTATNIVPELVAVEGEIRSYNHDRALQIIEEITRTFEKTTEAKNGSCRTDFEVHLKAYRIGEGEQVVQRFQRVCQRLGIQSFLTETFGGSDNNVFLQQGIRGIVLACGMNQVHTTKEYSSVDELEKCAAIVAGLMTEKN